MEKEKKLDSRCICIVSLGCRPQLHGHVRAGHRFPVGASPKQRRARRRGRTVLTAILAARNYLRTQSARRSLPQPAAPSEKSSVQGRLAWSARYCRFRIRDPADSRNRHGASEQILLAASGKSAPQSAREKERRIRRRRCIIPAAAPTSGAHLCSLYVPASPTHPWEFPHQIRLVLSQRIADTECLILPTQVIVHYLIERWWPLNLLPRHGKHLLSVRHSNTHFGQHSTDIFFARSVSAQETAATVLPRRGQPSMNERAISPRQGRNHQILKTRHRTAGKELRMQTTTCRQLSRSCVAPRRHQLSE